MPQNHILVTIAKGTPMESHPYTKPRGVGPVTTELTPGAEPTAAQDVDGALRQRSPLQAQLQATLNIIPAHSWYALPSGALTFVNQRTADYLGLPKDHPLRSGMETGTAWDSHLTFLHPDDQEHTRRIWSQCLRTGAATELSFRVRNAEGAYRWFLGRAEPVRAGDGTLLYCVGV